jgi:hypothetical protein
MKVFINWVSFAGGVLETCADALKKMIPRFESLKKANAANQLEKEESK